MRRTTTTTTAGVAVLAATLLLTGCTGGGDAGPTGTPTPTSAPTASPTPSTPDAAASGTPTPAPTATTAPVASIPTDCTDVVDAQTYAATFGETPLNPVEYPLRDGSPRGVHEPQVPTGGIAVWALAEDLSELTCLWRDPAADVTGLSVSLGRADETRTSALRASYAEGSSCTDEDSGWQCQTTSTTEPYGTQATETTLVRDGVFVHVSQSNFPTDDLLGSISTRIWG